MGLKPKAPSYPDPTKTANTQLQYGKDAAQSSINMNALDRSGPFGSATYQRDANGNITGQTVGLSGALQPGADATQGAYSAQAGLLPTTAFNPNVDGSAIRDAYQRNALLQAQPEWQRQDKQNEVRLSERGIPIGSEAYNDLSNITSGQRNNYLNQAANQSYIAGANEEQRQFGNQLTEYQLPAQMAGSSLGLLQGLNGLNSYAPQTSASVGAPNFSDLMQNKYNSDYQNYQNQIGGLGNLASAGLGLFTAPMTGGGGLGSSMLGRGLSSIWN